MDFSGEVDTAVRISDGCLLLVDCVEGVSAQTRTVLRQSWREKLKPILVLNKIDRLFTEMSMSATDVWHHLKSLIETINGEVAGLANQQLVLKTELKSGTHDLGGGWTASDDIILEETNSYFDPGRDNVIFSSAIGGWAFSINDRIDAIIKEFKVCPEQRPKIEKVLRKTIFGDFYLNKKKKCIERGAIQKNRKSLFVVFIGEMF